MIDHTGVTVSDFARSRDFYAAAFAPIGLKLIVEFPASVTGREISYTSMVNPEPRRYPL